jgi:sec-independent protein translocase protein TatA
VIEDLFTPMHLLVIFAIVFFLFGAKRLPQIGKSLGHGIHAFRGGIAGLSDADEDEELPAAAPAEPLAIEAPAAAAGGATVEAGDDEWVDAGDGEIVDAGDGGTAAAGDGETVAAGLASEQRAAS